MNTIRANTFLVGVAKGGTTSIETFLRSQDDVYLSPIKEPTYFCNDIRNQIKSEYKKQVADVNFDVYFKKNNLKLMHMALVEKEEHYSKLFSRVCNESVIAECSTFYFPSSVAAENIYKYNPDSKIIIVLRDPVKRICSHYEMDRRIGVTSKSLSEEVELELSLGEHADYKNCRYYLGASDYEKHLKRYYQVFGKSNIHVILFEDLINNPKEQLGSLMQFLKLNVNDNELFLTKENESKKVRFEFLNLFIYSIGLKPLIIKILSVVLPETVKKYVKSLYFKKDFSKLYSKEEVEYLESIVEEKYAGFYQKLQG